jgi:hypothetical protein
MRKLYEATGGQPQRWETLDNLGAVKADAGGTAYAVEAATRAARWRAWPPSHRGLKQPALEERQRLRSSVLPLSAWPSYRALANVGRARFTRWL